MLQHLQHLQLVLHRRIAEAEPHQKAVELSLGQRKGPFVIDGVLRGDDQERRAELVRGAVHRDAAFAHRFEQSRLRARRGPVDFVGQHDLGKDRAGAELELGRLLVEDRSAGHVGRQQVGRALNPLERAAHAAGQRPGEHRLGDARHVLQQNVPFAEPGNQRQDQLLPLADDGLLDVGDDLLRRLIDIRHESLKVFIVSPTNTSPTRKRG